MRTILVTGGTRGIGRAVVEALAREPAADRSVAFTWSSSETMARQLEAASEGRLRAFHLDLRDRSRPDDLVAEIEETWDRSKGWSTTLESVASRCSP